MTQLQLSRRRFGATALALAATGFARTLAAQDRATLRILVGAPAGGTSDVLARVLAEGLAPVLGRTVIVDNKPGAAGLLAIQDLLRSPRDGNTVLLAPNGVVSEIPHAMRMPVDPMKELQPIAELARTGLVFVGAPTLPVQRLDEALAFAKAQRGKLSYASYSPGTLSHTLGLELNRVAGLDLVHVAYKGSPPALTDLIGGQVHFMFDGPATSLPMIRGGKVKVFATTAPKRLAALPDVPTFQELGFRDLTALAWMGLWTSPDVPAAVQAKLRDATLQVLAQPAVRDRLAGLGLDPAGKATPEELRRTLKAESDRQAAVLKAIGFRPD